MMMMMTMTIDHLPVSAVISGFAKGIIRSLVSENAHIRLACCKPVI